MKAERKGKCIQIQKIPVFFVEGTWEIAGPSISKFTRGDGLEFNGPEHWEAWA